jgi:hypothetical protein
VKFFPQPPGNGARAAISHDLTVNRHDGHDDL